jgi:hypothetical protein
MVCEQAKHSKTLRLEKYYSHLPHAGGCQEMIRNPMERRKLFTGEFSFIPLFDNRTTNELGAGESRRGRGNAKGVRVPVIFDMGSVIPDVRQTVPNPKSLPIY